MTGVDDLASRSYVRNVDRRAIGATYTGAVNSHIYKLSLAQAREYTCFS